MWLLTIVASILAMCHADTYLHNPRGSNNRLDGKNANRANNNRMFDSQNNNQGGYNIGDKTDRPFGNDYDKQFHMQYFMSDADHLQTEGRTGTHLRIHWTNQHGCGGTEGNQPQENMFCQVLLQYMCRPAEPENDDADEPLRDGTSTQTQQYRAPSRRRRKKKDTSEVLRDDDDEPLDDEIETEPQRRFSDPNSRRRRRRRRRRSSSRRSTPAAKNPNAESLSAFIGRRNSAVSNSKGLHETFEWYDKCKERERNKGLYTADQNLNGDTSEHTRQNPGGTQNGYECPEERDYYPYWHPTDWKDIAVMGENLELCRTHYRPNSFNTNPKGECVEEFRDGEPRHYSKYNRKETCEAEGGKWLMFNNYLEKAPQHTSKSACEGASGNGVNYFWGRPMNQIEEMCLVALEEVDCLQAPYSRDNHLGNGEGIKGASYDWEIPYFPSLKKQTCVLRLRYNMSSDDYDRYTTDSNSNNNDAVLENNPEIDTGEGFKLQLAINTAQVSRTFEDRTHMFYVEPRPESAKGSRIFNLNVRGKRGNIQQVQNAVEYDFYPINLDTEEGDLIHFQWAGSNTHDNNGQGDDGQGRGGTDRNNIYQLPDRHENRAGPLSSTNMFTGAKVKWTPFEKSADAMTDKDIGVVLASSGYYECASGCKNRPGAKRTMDDELDNAPASFPGLLVQMKQGDYQYMCTRNNNFSNRSEKGTISVKAKSGGSSSSGKITATKSKETTTRRRGDAKEKEAKEVKEIEQVADEVIEEEEKIIKMLGNTK